MSKLSLIAMTVLAAALFAGSCARKPGLRFVDASTASAILADMQPERSPL